MLKLKLAKLSEALLKLNDGRGPDILAVVEVEGERAVQLLQQALNDRLPDERLHYNAPVIKEVAAGRHIAPAILTRLPVVRDKTRHLDKRLRILQAHLQVDDKELIVIASHWTSRVQDTGEKGRDNYADKIYGACNAIFRANPAADILVCGDFNDTPEDDSVVKNLHATGDPAKVRSARHPLHLYNLFAGKDPAAFGTHYYSRWLIFDQIVVSPGMLDAAGWYCDVDSVETVRDLANPKDKKQRPWRFGSEREKGPRGYSDHFPVTVRLKVEAAPQEVAEPMK
jgi:endonuclease/exonuclease/phosphatase family metal-dependent hydrolase